MKAKTLRSISSTLDDVTTGVGLLASAGVWFASRRLPWEYRFALTGVVYLAAAGIVGAAVLPTRVAVDLIADGLDSCER